MVPKDMGRSSYIYKVVRKFCKFSQKVKAVFIMSKNFKYPMIEGKTFQHTFFFCNVSFCDFYYFSFSQQTELYWVNILKYQS